MPFRRYLFWFPLLPLLMYLAVIPIVRAKSYVRWSASLWTERLDYAFADKRPNADVLIFGDSSAFLGIDPHVVNAELGLKSFVLPATIGSLPITGDMVLQHYLDNNKPPKLLVLYFSAWDLDYRHTPNVHMFEGEEMLLRHAGWPAILRFALQHPAQALLFPFRTYSLMGPKAILRGFRRKGQPPAPDGLGHFTYTDPFSVESPGCTLPDKPVLRQTGQETVAEMARRFSAKMKVVVYISPIPACTNASSLVERSYAAVGAAPPAVLPAGDFFGDAGYAHIEPEYVPLTSRMFANALREPLREAGVPTLDSHQKQ